MGRESSSRASGPSGARGQGQQAGYNRFFINCGRVHNMLPGDLIKFIARELGVRGGEVGRIDLKENFSFFEMPEKFKEGILDLNGRSLKGAPVFIEVAKADPVGGSRPRSNGPRSNGPRPSRPSGRREGGNFQRRSNPNSERSLFN
jgi:ATP-dependent RNA helicase DeaD